MVQMLHILASGVLQAISIQALVPPPPDIAQKPVLAQDSSRNACSFSSYTALGDSYACGFGSKQRLRLCQEGEDQGTADCTSLGCGKDTGGYPYLFWEQHKDKIKNFRYLACNGNDTGSVLDTQVNSEAFGKPDLVTINVGGDDQSFFANVGMQCLIPGKKFNATKCDEEIGKAETIIKDEGKAVSKIFDAIKHKTASQSNVRVVVMSYARLFGNIKERPLYCGWLPATIDQVKRINDLAIKLNGMLEKAAEDAQFDFVNVDGMFDGHRYCDTWKVWDYYFQTVSASGKDTGGVEYSEFSLAHPNLAGVENTYLKELNRVLGC